MGYFLRRGDVLLFYGSSKIGRLVRDGQRLPGQRYAPAVSHVALVVRDGEPAREPFAMIVEGADKVRRVRMYEKHANDHVWCYRPLPVPAGALEHIVRSIEGRVGEPYSFFELPARWIDNKLFRGRIVTRWLTKPIWGGVCSSVIAEEFERAGYPIAGRPGWAASPADIEALFLANPGEFPVTWCGYPREYAA